MNKKLVTAVACFGYLIGRLWSEKIQVKKLEKALKEREQIINTSIKQTQDALDLVKGSNNDNI